MVVVAGSNSGSTSGSSGSGTGSSGSGTGSGSACVCSVPVVVATGIYTVTVENTVNLGSTTYTTAYPTTTLGVFTVSAGTIVPAVATVTNSAVVAQNTNAALAPGQSYQTVTIPGTSTTVVLIVTVVTDVVTAVPANNGGSGVGAQPNTGATSSAPYTNSSMSSTALNGGAGVGAIGLSTTSLSLTAPVTASTSATVSASVGDAISATGAVVTSAAPQPTTTAAPAATQAAGTQATQVGDLGTTPLYNQEAFINDILSYHNTLRARNSAPAMTWNADLAQVALNNVNTNAADGTFLHTSEMGISTGYGENIAYQTGQNNPDYLVWLWYEENTSYDYNNPVFAENTGHFTQLVWVDSVELGCAYTQATDSAGTYYLACEYSPAGNYAGEFSDNVLPSTVDGQPAQPATQI